LRVIPVVAIAALGIACNSSKFKKAALPPEPPPTPPVTYSITAVGGEGTVADGGNGGYLQLEDYSGGDASVLKSGTVNTDFVLPTNLPYLGVNPWEVAADATLEVGTAGFHLVAGDASAVYDDSDVPVTGIHVLSGVTLTIKPNYDEYSGDGLLDTVYFSLDDGLIVEGTIKIAKRDATVAGDGAGTDTSDFYPYNTGGMWIADTGKIDVSGESSTSGAGANGGEFYTYPEFFFNAGVIDASGGSGTNGGGTAGGIYVYSDSGGFISTGSLLSNGGAGGSGLGGNAQQVYIYGESDQGYLISTGVISATGGNGATGGGDGVEAYLYNYYGNLLVSGTVNTYGGDATDVAGAGNGGAGGRVYAYIEGSIRWAASVDTHGGSAAGTGTGGNGGELDFDTEYNYLNTGSEEYPLNSQSVAFGGANVNLNGGAGATGGDAGYFYIYTCDEYYAGPGGAPLTLVGYTSIDISGGLGKVNGGDAGDDNYIEAWENYDTNDNDFTGNVVNEADITMRGGEGQGGYGGSGYGLTLESNYYAYPPYVYGTTNSGALDASGGKGTTDGGAGGDFQVSGFSWAKNTGAITASGGEAGTGTGGSPGEIVMYSEGDVTSADLTSNGGASDSGDGTTGGNIDLQAAGLCTVTGAVTASGGASASGTGGDGGYIWILSQGSPTDLSGTLTAAAGTGGTTPVDGEVWLDGGQISGPKAP
jgi:hypothetical protein